MLINPIFFARSYELGYRSVGFLSGPLGRIDRFADMAKPSLSYATYALDRPVRPADERRTAGRHFIDVSERGMQYKE